MGLFVQQNGRRSELQERIAAELQEKIRSTSTPEGTAKSRPHDHEESVLLEHQHETRTAGITITILVVVLIVAVAFLANQARH